MEKTKKPITRNIKFKLFLLLIIRIVQTFVVSIIPSFISVLLIFITPNEQMWGILKIAAFFTTLVCSWIMWMRFKARYEKTSWFYLINGTAYLVYFAVSVAGIFCMGYMVYSMSFANLRMFDGGNVKTLHSVISVNCIMVGMLVLCERFSAMHLSRIREIMKLNGADAIEIEEEDVVPTQNEQVIETMSAEQVQKLEEDDVTEAVQTLQAFSETMPETVIDEGITKGNGEAVEFVEITDIDNDLTQGDFSAAEELIKANEPYSGESLWNTDIYHGRTEGDRPITEYDDDSEIPDFLKNTETDGEDEDDPIWSTQIYQGRDTENTLKKQLQQNAAENQEIDYDADTLWEGSFYQGRSEENRPEHVLDFDNEVEAITRNEIEQYGSDSLWDEVKQGKNRLKAEDQDGFDELTEKMRNPNEDYDVDSLWNKEAFKHRMTNSEDEI